MLPLLASATGTALPPAALAYVGAPWWALLLASLPGILAGVVVLILGAVVPQASADRLAWWQALIDYRSGSRPIAPSGSDARPGPIPPAP
nr:hypothetical protein OH826_20110 [Streptomyces sp. NBC_00899]